MRYNVYMEIFDAHTHIFPPEMIRHRDRIARKEGGFALLYGEGKGSMADSADLTRYMATEQIGRSVICGFPFRDPGLTSAMNDYLLASAKENPNLVPLVSTNPFDEDEGLEELERCYRLGAKGAGEIALYDRPLGKQELEGLEGLAAFTEKKGGVLLLHMNEQVGHEYRGKAAIDFQGVLRFAGNHPGLTIILAHMGGGLCFYEFMPEIRRILRRVYYDTAAVPFLYGKEIYRFIETFLQEKTLFGSDFPLLAFSRYKEGMAGMSPEGLEGLLRENAGRIFGRS
jgi:uncharacterized protein